LLKESKCLLPLPTFHMSQYHGAPSDHIFRWHLVEHFPSKLNAPTFCIHFHEATPHKDIRLTTSLKELFMNKPTIFKCSLRSTYLNHLNKSEFVRTHSLSRLLEKLHHPPKLPILHMFCKLLIACKYIELHYTWCLRNYFCCHPWWVLSVLNPKCFPSVFVFEIWIPFICWSAMYSPHHGNKWYHKNREGCTGVLHQHIALTYFLQPSTTTPPVQRTWKEILPSLDEGRIAKTHREKKDWHQQEVWLHWYVNWDRFDVHLPSLIYDPNIAKDP